MALINENIKDIEFPKLDRSKVEAQIRPLIQDAAIAVLVNGLMAGLKSLITTNHKKSELKGDKELKPTNEVTTFNEKVNAATRTDKSLAQDDVKGQDGKIHAAEQDATAASQEATASDSGATAVRTKAGASDIETKALKMT